MKYFLACIILCLTTPLFAKTDVLFLKNITTSTDWQILKGKPLSTKYSNVESIKLIYEIKTATLYFANSTKYIFHYNFCQDVLKDKSDLYEFNQFNYSNHVKRKYIFANLNYFKHLHQYAIEFFPGDEITTEQIIQFYNEVSSHFKLTNQLNLVQNAEMKKNATSFSSHNIVLLDADSIYHKQAVQSLQLGVTYGKLRKIDINQIDKTIIKETDIVVTNGLPLDIPALSGILTAVLQTPLSHLSILCNNRKTPNAYLLNAWENKTIDSLNNTWVKYTVTNDTIFFSPSYEDEVLKNKQQTQKPQLSVTYNATSKNLVYFKTSNYRKNIKLIGAKATNFGEISNIQYSLGKYIPTPEAAFAIPFYYYVNHIKKNSIQLKINDLINTPSTQNELINKKLKAIRKSIMNAILDSSLINLVKKELQKYPQYTYFRFRSSTNAEDIKGFNGAGLYESVSGSVIDSNKTIEHAIKKVWASTWNEQAFRERQYFNINQKKIAMAILVHRAFGTELANGVAITKHLYRPDYPAFTINVQLGEESIVFPEKNMVAEQFLLSVDAIYEGNMALDHITYSNLSPQKNILSNEQLRTLYTYLDAIKKHYYYLQSENSNTVSYENFAMDIEFKWDALTRKLYIKQARRFD